MKILKVVIMAEFDDNKVRQILIKEDMIRKFIYAVAYQENGLKVLEEPIEGVTLETK